MTEHVTIWDRSIRLFHWGLAASVAGCLLTGFLGFPGAFDVHLWLGTLTLGLLAFRLVWGLVGSRHGRFRSFLYGPAAIAAHLAGIRDGRPARYPGHPPAGAAMVFVLLAAVLTMAATGLVALGGIEKLGPLATRIDFDTGRAAAEIHAFLAWGLLVLVAGHVAGVLVESRLTAENLARTMIDGRKRVAPDGGPEWAMDDDAPRVRLPGAALLGGFAIAAAFATLTLYRAPAAGLAPDSIAGTPYAEACGECHFALPPSLLPAETWRTMMATLDDHFGENASLMPSTENRITTFLVNGAADHWDVKAAHLFDAPAPDAPLSVTATRRWRHLHHDIPKARFKDPKIGAETNCGACHADASRGLFSLRDIHIPETDR